MFRLMLEEIGSSEDLYLSQMRQAHENLGKMSQERDRERAGTRALRNKFPKVLRNNITDESG